MLFFNNYKILSKFHKILNKNLILFWEIKVPNGLKTALYKIKKE